MGKINSIEQRSKSGEIIILRSARSFDAEKMNLLAMEVFRSSNYLISTPEEFSQKITIEAQVERIKKYEENEADVLLIAECNNELIGMIDFQGGKKIKTSHKGSFGMCVRPLWQNKGIGNALLSTLIEWVKAHPNIEVINLTVSEENKSAFTLYKKLGFEVTGREPFGLKYNGQFLVDLMMTLKL